jgi:hypothetical protein
MRLLADCILYTLFSLHVKLIFEDALAAQRPHAKDLILGFLPVNFGTRQEASRRVLFDLCYRAGKAFAVSGMSAFR